MAPKPSPNGPELWRWYDEADRDTRAAHPSEYWSHSYSQEPEFWWNETQVSEEEYRANAQAWALDRL
jgi:hypothetical protein